MTTKFTGRIRKANKSGTGFIQFPKEHRDEFETGGTVQVSIKHAGKNTNFFGRVRVYDYKGVYVSQEMIENYRLMGEEADIKVSPIEGFHTKIGSDGRIYFPIKVCEDLELLQDSIIKATFKTEEGSGSSYCRIDTRKRGESKEYCTFVGPGYSGKEAVITIERIDKKGLSKKTKIIRTLLKGFNFSILSPKEAIIVERHKPPLTVSTEISLEKSAHYLGAYFADGTKKGNSWAICASTFEQARYYLAMHKKIIKNANPKLNISFTTYEQGNDAVKKRIENIWLKNAKVKIFRIWLRHSIHSRSGKNNKYGTLVIRENRALILSVYKKLLELLIKQTTAKKKKMIALSFIFGVMEGDGGSTAKKRGHIMISTNSADLIVLKRMFETAGLKYKAIIESENRNYISISSMELLKKFLLIQKRIFHYYPKRRKVFFTRFIRMGAVQFVLGNKITTSGWIKKDLKDEGIINSKYLLTKKGMEIRKLLQRSQREISKNDNTLRH